MPLDDPQEFLDRNYLRLDGANRLQSGLILPRDPFEQLEAATKAYVDALDASGQVTAAGYVSTLRSELLAGLLDDRYSPPLKTFADGDTTPSVEGGLAFRTNNSNPTTITAFDGGIPGRVYWILIPDTNTTIDFSGTNLYGNNGVDWIAGQGDLVVAISDGANWYCVLSSTIVWDDLRVPAHATGKGAAAPDLGAFLAAGNLQARRFDGGVLTEQVYVEAQLQHTYREGTDIIPHIHWTPTDANAGNVKWQLDYTWATEGAVFPAQTTIEAIGAAGTAWEHTRTDWSAIAGAGKLISSMLECRLFRDPTDPQDTYGFDAAFLEIDFHYQVDTRGSGLITTK